MTLRVLDCTLRDGAYVVESLFGQDCIRGITSGLSLSGVDIVECGWLRNCVYNKDSVFYGSPFEAEFILPSKKTKYSLMFDYGKYDLNRLPENNGLIDIIRISFYKKNLDEILFAVETVKSKGYEVYLQPSYIMEYSDREIEHLCSRANFLKVNSVYIVDSYGSMFPEDLARIMPIFKENVAKDIIIGFHSHNNIQLSFGLTIQFMDAMCDRDINVDSTLCGIGRGAGNTKTELLLSYLNRKEQKYDIDIIKKCIEKYMQPLYEEYNWEYTPQKGYKGLGGLHPND